MLFDQDSKLVQLIKKIDLQIKKKNFKPQKIYGDGTSGKKNS